MRGKRVNLCWRKCKEKNNRGREERFFFYDERGGARPLCNTNYKEDDSMAVLKLLTEYNKMKRKATKRSTSQARVSKPALVEADDAGSLETNTNFNWKTGDAENRKRRRVDKEQTELTYVTHQTIGV